MPSEVTLPEIGAAPLHLSAWFAEVGDLVYAGDRLVEVAAQGATFDVLAPATGRLAARLAREDDAVQPGQVLAMIEMSAN